MSKTQPHCRLCTALNNPFMSGGLRTCDTVLFKTTSFAILPAIGPLSLGHVLIVSREHYLSLASMSLTALSEYQVLIEKLAQLAQINGDILEAEHGATADLSGGGCVSHAHVNVFPGLGEYSGVLDGQFPVIANLERLEQLKEIKIPYIALRAKLASFLVLDSRDAPSQKIRQALARRLGVVNWDWRSEPREELIERTVNFWRNILPNEAT